jgi:hypothetical protein
VSGVIGSLSESCAAERLTGVASGEPVDGLNRCPVGGLHVAVVVDIWEAVVQKTARPGEPALLVDAVVLDEPGVTERYAESKSEAHVERTRA